MYFPIIITLFYSFKDEIPITESSVNISVWYLRDVNTTTVHKTLSEDQETQTCRSAAVVDTNSDTDTVQESMLLSHGSDMRNA